MIFGSILPVLTYKTFDEALVKISATPHPLAAFIFSRDMAAIDRFVGELSFGGGAVINSRFLRFRNEFIGDGFVDAAASRPQTWCVIALGLAQKTQCAMSL